MDDFLMVQHLISMSSVILGWIIRGSAVEYVSNLPCEYKIKLQGGYMDDFLMIQSSICKR